MAVQNHLGTPDAPIFKGEDVVLPFQNTADGSTTPVPVDGWTIAFTLKRKQTDTEALLSIPATPGAVGTGQYSIALSHAQTVGLAAGAYYYDIQRTDNGSDAVLSYGSLTITQEVLYP